MLRLVLGNLNYSSWSMRPWLALKRAGAKFQVHDVGLRTAPDWKERILSFSGAGKVPILVDGSLSIHESLAICEYVAELHPEAKLWPADMKLRARGRAISCEMLSGFSALRSCMSTNLRARAEKTPDAPGVRADIARIFDIWTASLESTGGPFLLGEFSIADCMYFPVATRFRTYGVGLPERLARYSAALFGTPEARELEQIAATTPAIPEYDVALRPL
ncbi:MAG TPA: glutathione S-transferase family protein [Polyangiaceae bacterium]|nr:glutathione S-transferase family protein [Polyangiaceae bacterium]